MAKVGLTNLQSRSVSKTIILLLLASSRSPNLLVVVVHLGVLARKLLLALLVGKVSADLVAVLLGLQQRNQVDARPHLLAGQLATNTHVLVSTRQQHTSKRTTYLASRMPPISLYQP